MKSKVYFLTVLVILSSLNMAIAQDVFATVDYRTCLVLHPEMKAYDFVAQRFAQPNLKRSDVKVMEAMYKKMAARQKLLKPKIDTLTIEQSQIQEKIAKTMLNWTSESVKLASQDLSKEEIVTKTLEVQAKDKSKIEKLQEQIFKIEKKIDALKDSIWEEVFLSHEKTAEKMQKIVSELDDTIKKVAKKFKVSSVIDNTLSAPQTPSKLAKYLPENTPLWCSPIYQMILESPLPKPNTFTIANHWAPSLMKSIENLSFQYLSHRNNIAPLVSTMRPSKLFILGGMDITATVCRDLFKKYKFNPYLIESLLVGIKKFQER